MGHYANEWVDPHYLDTLSEEELYRVFHPVPKPDPNWKFDPDEELIDPFEGMESLGPAE